MEPGMLTGKCLSVVRRLLSVIGGKGRRTTQYGQNRQPTTENRQRTSIRGFTLLELMIALSVVLILASFAIPAYYLAIQRAREAVLRQDLYTLRSLIDEFTVDKQRPPASLQELVEGGYLRGGIPADPITGSSESWRVDIEDVPGPDQAQPGVVDVHSGSDDNALDGTAYSSW